MTRLTEILKIKLEEQLLIKYCVIKHLILLKIQNMVYKFFGKKKLQGKQLKMKIFLIKN